MGSAFYPGALISQDAGQYIQNYQENLALFHFGDSIPWMTLAKCENVDDCELTGKEKLAYDELKEVMDQLALHAKSGKRKVYLSVSPINNDRNGVATSWESEANQGFSPPATVFSDEKVRNLYKKWVSYLVGKLKPDYLSQGIEFNMYVNSKPNDSENLISLLSEVKAENESKTQVIGPSIQWEFFKESPISPNWDALGSGFAFSTYPHILQPSDLSISQTHYNFEEFGLNLGEKPLFISEAGVSHEYQEMLLESLFSLKEKGDLQGVIWFFKEDAEGFFSQLPNSYPFTVFQKNGLYSDSGSKNPGATRWEAKLNCSG